MIDPISPSAYWDGIAEAWAARPRQRLWRRYSDVLHSRLVAEWLPSTPVKRILKTDAFDEATGELGRFLVQATGGALLVTLDVSMTTLRQARERHHGLSPLAGSVRRLPLSDASFDSSSRPPRSITSPHSTRSRPRSPSFGAYSGLAGGSCSRSTTPSTPLSRCAACCRMRGCARCAWCHTRRAPIAGLDA